MTYHIIKRGLDLTGALLGLTLLSPILILVSIMIKLDSPGPVFFRQKRIGQHRTTFTILKFRTMKQDVPKDVPTHLLNTPEKYLTGLGKWLRKTSIDELPQLWNVLRGEMSLVGPRPALYNQYDLIELREAYGVHEVKPGVTGLAQINGRDELTIEAKAEFDREYVKKCSILIDIGICCRTMIQIVKGKGIKEGYYEDSDHR